MEPTATITININPEVQRRWSATEQRWIAGDAVDLTGKIPAPIDPECLTDPGQIETGDQVMVHAMGSWYPATTIAAATRAGHLARSRAGNIEVEYTSGAGKVRRKVVKRALLVPAGCGYPNRHDSHGAAAWAAGVWAALAQFREAAKIAADAVRSRRCPKCGALCDHEGWDGINCPWCANAELSAGIAKLNTAITQAFDEGTLPSIEDTGVMLGGGRADDIVTDMLPELLEPEPAQSARCDCYAGGAGHSRNSGRCGARDVIDPTRTKGQRALCVACRKFCEAKAAESPPAKARRRVTFSVNLPVTVELVVESEAPIDADYPLEDAQFTVVDILNINAEASVSQVNEAIGNHQAEAEELDRRARAAAPYEPGEDDITIGSRTTGCGLGDGED